MFLVREARRGRGVTVLSRDKTQVSCGVGGGGEYRKMGRKCLDRMTLKCRDVWNAKQWQLYIIVLSDKNTPTRPGVLFTSTIPTEPDEHWILAQASVMSGLHRQTSHDTAKLTSAAATK